VLAPACAVLLVLVAAVLLLGVLPGDPAVRNLLLSLDSPGVRALMHVINYAGEWKVLLPATFLLLAVFPDARRRWVVWLGLMIAAPLAETVLKVTIARPRPESLAHGFPSGHVTAAAAFFTALIYLAEPLRTPTRRAVRVAAVSLILLVGMARIMLRAHWPSDVLGGLVLGVALASIAALLAAPDGRRRISERGAPGP
jgi:undecaprenyl-diphosphatase